MHTELPLMIAHNPLQDHKYKSKTLTTLDEATFNTFVGDVLSGKMSKILKSQPVPTTKVIFSIKS